MQNYAGDHGRLPPAVVYSEDGKPLLSWRVLILPYLDQEQLFRRFRLNEPWDSEHNIKLLPEMPVAYTTLPSVARKMPEYHTICHVFVGKGTAFESKIGLSLKDDFPNGSSNTILLVEAGKPVPWTKPENLDYDPDKPLPELIGVHRDGFRAMMAACHGRLVSYKTSERSLRAAIERNGKYRPGSDF
jgi:hypothetical protein